MEMREEKLYSTGEAAKLLGISFITIKRWIYAGKIRAIMLPTKRYRIPESEVKRLLGQPTPKNQAIIYARVTSANQKEDLKRQLEMLQKYAREKGYRIAATFEDVASGLKDNRRGLKKMFDALRAGQADVVVVAWKDRLTRFGFGYLKNHAEDLGARVEVVNEQGERTPHEELVEDLLAIVTSFSGRLYGVRSNKTRKVVESVKRAVR
jgi:putative resolvase